MNTNQIETFSEKITWRVGSQPINVQHELESFQAQIKELNEELSKKELIITFLRKDREILIDENERLKVDLEKNLTALGDRQKRTMYLY